MGKDYNKLKTKINENKELFQIPIALRLAYNLYKNKKDGFDFVSRFDLYSRIVGKAKSENKKIETANVSDFGELLKVLHYISFKALKKGIINKIDEKNKPENFLRNACGEYYGQEPHSVKVDKTINAFKIHDSIFGIFTRQEGIFEYYHQSFQEYFAACYLKEYPEEINKYLYHPLFKEVLIFLGGGLETKQIKEIIIFLIDKVHKESEKEKIKSRTWQNYEVASWLIKDAQEKELLTQFFWDKLDQKGISFNEYLDSKFYLPKIIKIIENLYGIQISQHDVEVNRYLNTKVLTLLIEREKNSINSKQKIITFLHENLDINSETIDFIVDNNFHKKSKIGYILTEEYRVLDGQESFSLSVIFAYSIYRSINSLLNSLNLL